MFKQLADLHHRSYNFTEGDYVMIRIRLEQFPLGTIKKLYVHGAGPFKILKKLGSNTYIINLPSD